MRATCRRVCFSSSTREKMAGYCNSSPWRIDALFFELACGECSRIHAASRRCGGWSSNVLFPPSRWDFHARPGSSARRDGHVHSSSSFWRFRRRSFWSHRSWRRVAATAWWLRRLQALISWRLAAMAWLTASTSSQSDASAWRFQRRVRIEWGGDSRYPPPGRGVHRREEAVAERCSEWDDDDDDDDGDVAAFCWASSSTLVIMARQSYTMRSRLHNAMRQPREAVVANSSVPECHNSVDGRKSSSDV